MFTISSTTLTLDISKNPWARVPNPFSPAVPVISSPDASDVINKFLPKINLRSQFKIIVNNNIKNFFIDIKFLRSDKEQVDFDNLTTPEKIFFIIVFYISIKLHVRYENIIFSNISILNKYNKAGSIYRTIRKILPIFKKDHSLSKFNLIFIMANLELKKEIKNLKVNTIKES